MGRKPKPAGQIRHRMQPTHEWTEIPNVPFEGGPKLPARPRPPRALTPPAPRRPLGRAGLELWERTWGSAHVPPNEDQLLQLCEQIDERAGLRLRVLEEGGWRDRNGLRQLDTQVTAGLVALADAQAERAPATWPRTTKAWWAAVSRLPHAVLWAEADWQFALDTAELVAAFHAGNHQLAPEIRRREAIMGTTRDARRDLRIRYVDPLVEDEGGAASPNVTAMAQYRASVQA
jgi:hypothetical protein